MLGVGEMPDLIDFQRLRTIFTTYTSMDEAQRSVTNAFASLNEEQQGVLWLTIFNYSDILGATLNTSPHIRGRAGEMVVKSILQSMAKYGWLGKDPAIFHSFHVRGTEQDFFVITDKGIILLEVKSQRSKDNKKMNTTIKGGKSQHQMHLERIDEFITKDMNFNEEIRGVMYVVYVKSGEDTEESSDKSSCSAQQLCHVLREVYNRWGSPQSGLRKLMTKVTDYYNSEAEQIEEAKHKKRLGYK